MWRRAWGTRDGLAGESTRTNRHGIIAKWRGEAFVPRLWLLSKRRAVRSVPRVVAIFLRRMRSALLVSGENARCREIRDRVSRSRSHGNATRAGASVFPRGSQSAEARAPAGSWLRGGKFSGRGA